MKFTLMIMGGVLFLTRCTPADHVELSDSTFAGCLESSLDAIYLNASSQSSVSFDLAYCGPSGISPSQVSFVGLPESLQVTQLTPFAVRVTWLPGAGDARLYDGIVKFPHSTGLAERVLVLSRAEKEDLTRKTLVVFNRNSTASSEIAYDYAAKRGIEMSHVCGVEMPVGLYAEAKHFLSLRNQMLSCICLLISESDRPTSCTLEVVDTIAAVSPITHVALIRGIPARILNPDTHSFANGAEDPSLDYFLSQLLYSNVNPFESGVADPYNGLGNAFVTSPFFALGSPMIGLQWQAPGSTNESYVRSVLPVDRTVAYGRIEAMTVDRTKDLIDRTLNAEQLGFQGNVVIELNDGLNCPLCDVWKDPRTLAKRALRIFDSPSDESCLDYVRDPSLLRGPWDPNQCRVGFTSGQMPGEGSVVASGRTYPAAEVPLAVNVGMFLGMNPSPNTQIPFDGFANLLKWRHTESACTPLCQDLSQPEQSECRARSKDFFKEINTDCVGVAPGFIGHQVRSWPVTSYGFSPAGWMSLEAGGNGAYERTPPVLKMGDAFHNATFTDDAYVEFGYEDEIANPTCPTTTGSVEDCAGFVPMGMGQEVYFSPVAMTAGQNSKVTFYYRTPDPSNRYVNALLNVYVAFYASPSSASQFTVGNINLQSSQIWTQGIVNFTPPSNFNMVGMRILFKSTNLRGRIQLDAVDFENVPSLVTSLFVNRSFSDPQINTAISGSYAAHVIDRMGGIGWWGSSSHYKTGGFAFYDDDRFLNAFMSGRSLGESLLYEGSNGISGIIYGDPLYRPAAVKIWLEGTTTDPLQGTTLSSEGRLLMISAVQGLLNQNDAHWDISVCSDLDVNVCGHGDKPWITYKQGTGAVEHFVVGRLTPEILHSLGDSEVYSMRLKVTPKSGSSIISYLFLRV